MSAPAAMPDRSSRDGRRRVIAALGVAQTLAWASSYYLLAVLADPIARELSLRPTVIFGAFSAALLISALLGPRVGRSIDRLGGRQVLAASSLLFALGLGLLAVTGGTTGLWLAWLVLGAAMGLGLYDAAFATLARIYGAEARGAITGITLIAGFASTIGWPLTALLEAQLGWRGACAFWALAHLVLGLPLNLMLPAGEMRPQDNGTPARIRFDRRMWLLGFAFAVTLVVSSAMAAHLPRVIAAAGGTAAVAIAAGALIGPAQVVARLIEVGFMQRFHPVVSARLAPLGHLLGALLLLLGGPVFAMPFAVLHGAGNGLLTIVRGTVPLAIFGAEHYGYRLGLLSAPARFAQAAAPFLFGVLIENLGSRVLYVSAMLCLLGALALFLVSPRPADAE